MAETCPSCKSPHPHTRYCFKCCATKHISECAHEFCRDTWHDAKEEKMGEQFAVNRPGDTIPGIGNTSERAPAQATREQLEAALKEMVDSITEAESVLPTPTSVHGLRVRNAKTSAERLLGGK